MGSRRQLPAHFGDLITLPIVFVRAQILQTFKLLSDNLLLFFSLALDLLRASFCLFKGVSEERDLPQ